MLHPEATPDPAVVVWVVAPGPVSGCVDSRAGGELPARLAGLLQSGLLSRVQARPGSVTITLAEGYSWAADGAEVRAALLEDLGAVPWPESGGSRGEGDESGRTVAGGTVSAGPVSDGQVAGGIVSAGLGTAGPVSGSPASGGGHPADDAEIHRSVQELLAGPVGAVAASHGGRIRLVAVRDGVVDLQLQGACNGCAAAELTLGRRIEAELRRRHRGVRAVRQVHP